MINRQTKFKKKHLICFRITRNSKFFIACKKFLDIYMHLLMLNLLFASTGGLLRAGSLNSPWIFNIWGCFSFGNGAFLSEINRNPKQSQEPSSGQQRWCARQTVNYCFRAISLQIRKITYGLRMNSTTKHNEHKTTRKKTKTHQNSNENPRN